ncbi:hypothetical protein ACA910_013633 [Epithemia clementina (nom. ined.)]
MGNSASQLPYTIGNQVTSLESDGWMLHDGQQKSDGAAVSVFVAKKPALVKANLLQPALHHFTQCKKLRHPHILSVHATLDTDDPTSGSDNKSGSPATSATNTAAPASTGDLIIVTEPCITLEAWIQKGPPPEELAWGLEGVVRALHFLHASANLSHCNVSPSSFFVTKAGDVKLWNFSLVTPVAAASGGLNRVFLDFGSRITPRQYQSPERVEQRWDAIQSHGTTHNMDAYSLAVLIPQFYGGHIPGPLQKAVQRLLTPNLKMRPRLQPLLKCPLFDTPYQKTQLQLLEFAVQPVEAKIEFWKNLLPTVQAQLISTDMAAYKILPLMKTTVQTICSSESIRTQDLYRKEVLMILPPMFYIAEHFLADKFAKELSSMISLLFSINDRGIRGSLLKKVPLLVKHLDNSTLNVSVFEPMCSGFSDSAGALRELTLNATLSLVPHLTQPNLEKLSRYLVRLQNDEETAIRTNTVYFFSKLAPHLTETTRQKLLLPAFIRAMKDPFTPCRLAALQSTLQAKQFFDVHGIASKVLPAVTPCCVDPDAGVRKEAFSAVEELLYLLRQESERLSRLPQNNQNGGTGVQGTIAPPPATAPMINTATTTIPLKPSARPLSPTTAAPSPEARAPAPSSGGYFPSWMTSSTKKAVVAAPAPLPPPPLPLASVQAPQPIAPATAANSFVADDGWGDNDDDDDGWGDDDTPAVSRPAPAPAVSLPAPVTQAPANVMTSNMAGMKVSEDDLFGAAFGGATVTKPIMATQKPTTGKLRVPTSSASKKAVPKPVVQKLAAETMDDGWDDF